MPRYDFTVRIHKPKGTSILNSIKVLTLSGIHIISKKKKFGGLCYYKENQIRFMYNIDVKGKFAEVSGSHSSPTLTFKGKYIDIELKNFPRYPAFYQTYVAARDNLNGYGYTNHINKGFETYLMGREIEILNLRTSEENKLLWKLVY